MVICFSTSGLAEMGGQLLLWRTWKAYIN